MQKLVCPKGGASHLTFSTDGDWLAGLGPVGAPTKLYCWTRSRDWAITGCENLGEVTGLAFHPGGRTLAYASIMRSMWKAQAPVPPPPPPGATPPSVWRRRLAKNADDTRPFTGVHFHALDAIDEFVPNRVGVPRPENAPPNTVVMRDTWARGLTFTPDGRWLLAAQIEHPELGITRANVLRWHFTETDGVWLAANTLADFDEAPCALLGGYLALAGAWGVAAAAIESPNGLFVPDVRAATAVAVAPRDELIATCERGGPVFVWSLRAANPVATIAVNGWATVLAFSPDGQTLAVGHAGSMVGFWDAHTGTPGPVRDYGVNRVTALAYAPDGLTLAVAGSKGAVVVDTE